MKKLSKPQNGNSLAATARKALKGMSRCMPETRQEDLGCAGCPYNGAGCLREETVGVCLFPPAMLDDIRYVLREAVKLDDWSGKGDPGAGVVRVSGGNAAMRFMPL